MEMNRALKNEFDNTGLEADTIELLRLTFSKLPWVKRVVLYGSRAKGTHKLGSDIDITVELEDASQGSLATLFRIQEAIEDLDLIYKFDISLKNDIQNDTLIHHIERVGKTIYQRAPS